MKNVSLIFIFLGFAVFAASAQIAEKAEDISPLLIGETISEAELKAPDATSHKISAIIAEKPTVLLFYRGGWCPFCNAHLSEIQGVQSEVVKLGYQIVAISPDSPKNLQATDEKDKLDYSLYSDADGKFIQSLGIAFKAPEKYSGMLNEKSDGLNDGFLPVPSVFVVDTSGKIQFEYINPDYKVRLSAGLLMAVLRELKNEQ
ncbi:peroxiredoxin-like family protein [Prolixibacter sp. NT017]|uniref:peroxiredoxin-like family protein n=1 Tax=Prolixibacter sp. NT017 TaxID=2652390 RepID=UPI001283CB44|nr:peroxiredoxin-like family protein [Prolixibacter sp. NT017]GET24428.1 peroxiredoxin [Prolixibacter sp. NT017]